MVRKSFQEESTAVVTLLYCQSCIYPSEHIKKIHLWNAVIQTPGQPLRLYVPLAALELEATSPCRYGIEAEPNKNPTERTPARESGLGSI